MQHKKGQNDEGAVRRKHEKWKKWWNMKKVRHEKSATQRESNKEKSAAWKPCNPKKCNIKRVQEEESAPWKKRSTERVQQRKSATWTNHRESEQNLEKPAKEECTIAHKRIMGSQLTGYYALVKIRSNKHVIKTLISGWNFVSLTITKISQLICISFLVMKIFSVCLKHFIFTGKKHFSRRKASK